MNVLVVEIPWPPRMLSPNARAHWARRSAKSRDYRVTALALTRAAIKKSGFSIPKEATAPGCMHMHIDFYPPDRRLRDDDNAIASFKAARDGIAAALNCDDRIFRIHPFLSPDPVPRGKVVVTIKNDDGYQATRES